MSNPLYMVFDVESIGLHGEAFAAAYVVVDADGQTLAEDWWACPPETAMGAQSDREWVAENIPPLDYTCRNPKCVRIHFWDAWRRWAGNGALLVADCGWPVEARFLAECVDDDRDSRAWAGPYPLHELATLRLARGLDPLGNEPRLPNEPKHHPLWDAHQSARLLLEALSSAAS